MDNIIRFLIESLAISALLYLLYVVAFRSKASYFAQRAMLLMIPLIATLSPLVSLDLIALKSDRIAHLSRFTTSHIEEKYMEEMMATYAETYESSTAAVESLPNATQDLSTNTEEKSSPTRRGDISIATLLLSLWGVVTFSLSLLYIYRLRKIASLRSVAVREEHNDYTLYRLSGVEMLFSFWRGVYLNSEIAEQKLEIILRHELSHIRKYHYLDKLIMQIYSILLWFNPFVKIIQREISLIQEYEADNAVIESGCNARRYKMYIFEEVTSQTPTFANGLNSSQIKKRFITMKAGYKVSHRVLRRLLTTLTMVAIAASSLLYVSAKSSSSVIASLDLDDIESVDVKDGNITVRLKNGNIVVDRASTFSNDEKPKIKYPYVSNQNKKSIEIDEERLCVVVTLKDDSVFEIPLDDIPLDQIKRVTAPNWVVTITKTNDEQWVNSDGTWRKKAPQHRATRDQFYKARDFDRNDEVIVVREPNQTKVYMRAKVRWNTEFFVFDRSMELIDPKSDKRYVVESADNGLPLSMVVFVHKEKDEHIYFEFTFPPLDADVTTVHINEVANPETTIGYNATNKGWFVPDIKVTTQTPYFVDDQYQAEVDNQELKL